MGRIRQFLVIGLAVMTGVLGGLSWDAWAHSRADTPSAAGADSASGDAHLDHTAGSPDTTVVATAGADVAAHGDKHIVTDEGPPTADQVMRATALYRETAAAVTPRWVDPRVAEADGFHSLQGAESEYVHYVNFAFLGDEAVLDPNQPESLVYRNTPTGQVLEAAMYILPSLEYPIPDVGGSLTPWHNHDDLCFRTTDGRIVGALTDGPCPAGSINTATANMLHVWIVDHEGGPFAGIE